MIPVILSGGSGTRLWPVSRAAYPKQFCDFFDGSFLGSTIDRLQSLGEVHVLTTQAMETLTQSAVAKKKLRPENVLFEPFGKNTGPAVALLCHILQSRGAGDEIVGVFPSDHLIAEEEVFHRAVKLADQVARQGYVVTLGVLPTQPATGFGYIEVSDEKVAVGESVKAMGVTAFREKPTAEVAKKYVQSGRHFWNAGMFVFKVSDMSAAFAKMQPKLWKEIQCIRPDMSNAQYHYAMVESISLDYAIMEHLERQVCIPCDMGWSDVGSWDEMARLAEESALQTKSRAEVFNVDSDNNYVFSVNNKVVGLLDVKGLIVVDTPDALLVSQKGSSQKVRELVEELQEAGQPEATAHPFETRPWGRFEVLADEPEFKAKKLVVEPHQQLSYQSHAKRSEHWVVIAGQAEVTLNDRVHVVKMGEYIFIPVGTKHRVRNPGRETLVIVEVQTGSYFGEDDIVRYKDDYKRETN